MKKYVVCITIILVTLILGLIIYVNQAKKILNYIIEDVKEINYMLFSENNKFGVINKNGEIIVPSVYDEIQIPNPSKPLFICMNNYNPETSQYNIKVLNEKNEQILYEYVFVEAIKLDTGNSNIPFEKSILKYQSKGKFGLINFQGDVIVKAKYDEIKSLGYKEGLLLVKRNGKYGVININGKTVIKEKYDFIQSDGYFEEKYNFENSGFIVGNYEGNNLKLGYINSKGKKVLNIKYNQIERIKNVNNSKDIYIVAFEEEKAGFYINNKNIIKNEYEDIFYDENTNYLILQKDGKQGVSDLQGNNKIELKYDYIFTSGKYINCQLGTTTEIYDCVSNEKLNFENALCLNEIENNNYSICITKEEKYKILDNTTKEIKEQEYDYLEHISNDYFIAMKNNKYGIVTPLGNTIIEFKYNIMQKVGNTKIIQAINTTKEYTDIIINGKIITSLTNLQIYIKENYLILQSGLNLKYIDYNGNEVQVNNIINNDLYAYESKGKWGFTDKNNNVVITPQYDFVTQFNEYGFAGIQVNGKWGSINKKGEVIIEPTYTIENNNPNFVGKFYEKNLEYGQPYYVCK